MQFNTILTNLFLVTVVAQFTTKTTNLGRAISFLSLKSCSIHKLKFHMVFTCKRFMFSDFTWKASTTEQLITLFKWIINHYSYNYNLYNVLFIQFINNFE